MNKFRNNDGIADVTLDSQTGELTGDAVSIAWMIFNGVLNGQDVMPKFSEELRAAVLENLETLKGAVAP